MANPISRALDAINQRFKAAFSLSVFRSGAQPYAWLPRTRRDYAREVGDGSGSSVVMPSILWLMRTYPEAPIRVRRKSDGEVLTVHPMTDLLDNPNPYYDGNTLIMASAADYALTGNAYWVKARNTRGRPVELWWIPSSLLEPAWDDKGDEFITHYEYEVDGIKRRIEREDVVHFRFGMDPRNPRKGLSQLASVLREVFTDDEAANFSASLLANLGVPGVILSPGSDESLIDPEDAKLMAEQWQQRFGGDKRGRPLIATTGMKAQVVSFSPDQMNLTMLRRLPEERVSAALGIPAIVVGYGVGLEHSTYSNVASAREMAYENNILPTKRLWASTLTAQLLRDFDTSRTVEAFVDISDVRVLQDDQDKLFARLSQAVQGGWMTVAEARNKVGMDAKPEDDVYLRPRLSISIPVGADPVDYITSAFVANTVPLLNPPAAIRANELTAQPVDTTPADSPAGKAFGLYEVKIDEAEAASLEQRMAAAIGAALAEQLIDVVARIVDGEQDPALGAVADALQRAILPVLADGAVTQAAAAGVAIGVPADVAVVNQAALAWAREYSYELVRGLTETTQGTVRQAITTWVQTPGMTRGQLEDLLRPAFGQTRAEAIAVTEVTRSVSEGTNIYQRVLKDSGIEMVRLWQTNNDDRTCPVCAPLNGKSEADWADTYTDGPPAHVRCRCTTTLRLKR